MKNVFQMFAHNKIKAHRNVKIFITCGAGTNRQFGQYREIGRVVITNPSYYASINSSQDSLTKTSGCYRDSNASICL